MASKDDESINSCETEGEPLNAEKNHRPHWIQGNEVTIATRRFGGFLFAKAGNFFLTEDCQANRRKVWQGHYIDWNVRLRVLFPGAEKESNTVYIVTVADEIKYAGLTQNAIEHRWGLTRKRSLELPHYGYSFFIWHSDVVDYAIQAALGTRQGTKENLEAPEVEYWICTNPYKLVDGKLVNQHREIEATVISLEQPAWNSAGK
jgi:hypothetical protein